MKFLRKRLDRVKHNFEKGGKWEKFYYAFEAFDTFLYAPNSTNKPGSTHIKDAVDLKRVMVTVIIAMTPCLLFGMWNVGYQHFLAIGKSPSFIEAFQVGIVQVLPIVIVSYVAGLTVEFIFSIIRRHPVNEGFLVTGLLIPLVMPPNIPLWEVGLATAFAVVFAKEVFGGTGMNIVNVALTARAFLYFAYPSDISGSVWTFLGDQTAIEGFSGATPLAIAAESVGSGSTVISNLNGFGSGWSDQIYSFYNLFLGVFPGSIGETSVLMCLIGALVLLVTRVASGKIIIGVFAGAWLMGAIMNLMGLNEFMMMPAQYHLVIGGLAFGAVFMATDPVTAPHTETGKWFYGILIGMFTVMIRVWNPAYPEGIMLAILLMNIVAPMIDYFVVNANKKRRINRATV